MLSDKGIPIDKFRAELDSKVQYLENQAKEKQSTIDKLKKQVGELEYFETKLIQSLQALPTVKVIEPFKLSKIEKGTDHDALLCIADPHAEEFVDFEEMEGYASYDWGAFLSRMWCIGEKTIELTDIMRAKHNVSNLKIALLGDMLTGIIHEELDRTNTFSTPETVVRVANIVAQLLIKLSAHFDSVDVECVVGNHGRYDKKPPAKQRVDRNWDYGVYQIAKLLTANNTKINWNIPKSQAHVFKIAGARILVKHGDGIRHTGILPYYGINRDVAEEHEKRKGKDDFDYMIMGHWHHWSVVKGHVLLIPSIIGPSQYSFNRLHSVYPPESFLFFSTAKREYGIVDYKPIKLQRVAGHKFIDKI